MTERDIEVRVIIRLTSPLVSTDFAVEVMPNTIKNVIDNSHPSGFHVVRVTATKASEAKS